MSGEVLVTISGRRALGGEGEDVKLVTPALCSEENGCHLIRYTERGEDGSETENTILIGEGRMRIQKKGFSDVQMDFVNRAGRIESRYSTPCGDILIGIATRELRIDERGDGIEVTVEYAVDVGGELLSDCAIRVAVSRRA